MLIEACRLVHTERCQLMCKQRGRQQVSSFSAPRVISSQTS